MTSTSSSTFTAVRLPRAGEIPSLYLRKPTQFNTRVPAEEANWRRWH
jgi:hypothetical protein